MGLSESASLDVERIREDFPILEREFAGEQLAYLDNAATSQTPDQVVDAIAHYYRHTNANVHRGLHQLSQEASIAYEEAHDRVADFIGDDGRKEVVFGKNTTEAMNTVAYLSLIHTRRRRRPLTFTPLWAPPFYKNFHPPPFSLPPIFSPPSSLLLSPFLFLLE
jgi:selenocysteine lyase/cysteine desulfurase